MKAGAEWTTGLMRAGTHYEKHGDPYEFACHVIRIDETAYIFGAVGKLTGETVKAIRLELSRYGITKVEWTRKKNGRVKPVSATI